MIKLTKINGHDVRFALFDPKVDEIYPAYEPGKTIRGIATGENADVAINFNFANTMTGSPIGRIIVDGETVVDDIAKTQRRDELYMLPDRTLHIGRAPKGAVWSIQGSPPLVKNGLVVVNDYIVRDNTGTDIWQRKVRRTAVGLTGGRRLIVASTVSELSLEDMAGVMRALGCTDALNGDGGGSSYIWPQDQGPGRLLGSALIMKKGEGEDRMKIFGIDCAVPLTSKTASELVSDGAKFAVRYLVPAPYAWKRLTKPEADAIQVAGMKVASVFQEGKNGPVGGAVAGKVDGKKALVEAELIGQPVGSAIFFVVDYDAKSKDYDAIEDYLRAAQAELPDYLVGVYGHFGVIEEMAKRKACRFFWQTYAWSDGKKSNHVHLWQYKNDTKLADHSVDLNEAYTEEIFWGQRGKGGAGVSKTTFKDVPADHWAEKSIQKAAEAGVINGVKPDEFGLGQPVTREQLAVILDRLGLLEKEMK